MKKTHRVWVSLGIITSGMLSLFFVEFLHISVLASVITNLIWLWDDLLPEVKLPPVKRRVK